MGLPVALSRYGPSRRGLTVAGMLLASLGVTTVAGASPTASSPAAMSTALKHSLAAATAAGSARITVQFVSGSTTGKVVQDSSARTGKQTVAIRKEIASVILVGGNAYISGNTKGLTSYFGLPGSVVHSLSGRWVSVRPTDALYDSVSANVTLSSALKNVTPTGALVAGKPSKVNGQRVRSMSGEAPGGGGRLTLFVAANKRALPVEAVETSGTGTSTKGEIVRFTRWGEHVNVAAPAGPVPFAAIQATLSSPSG